LAVLQKKKASLKAVVGKEKRRFDLLIPKQIHHGVEKKKDRPAASRGGKERNLEELGVKEREKEKEKRKRDGDDQAQKKAGENQGR